MPRSIHADRAKLTRTHGKKTQTSTKTGLFFYLRYTISAVENQEGHMTEGSFRLSDSLFGAMRERLEKMEDKRPLWLEPGNVDEDVLDRLAVSIFLIFPSIETEEAEILLCRYHTALTREETINLSAQAHALAYYLYVVEPTKGSEATRLRFLYNCLDKADTMSLIDWLKKAVDLHKKLNTLPEETTSNQ